MKGFLTLNVNPNNGKDILILHFEPEPLSMFAIGKRHKITPVK